MSRDPYLDALTLLARRELSETQVRRRLTRRGHEAPAIDAAIARLRRDGALNDERVARAIARTEIALRRRGRRRVRSLIEAAGVPSAIADRAVDEVFGEVDETALLSLALERRLRGAGIADRKQMRRLHRYLVAQGFDPQRVLTLLRQRFATTSGDPDEADPQASSG